MVTNKSKFHSLHVICSYTMHIIYLCLPSVNLLSNLLQLSEGMVFSCPQHTLKVIDAVGNSHGHLFTLRSCLGTLVQGGMESIVSSKLMAAGACIHVYIPFTDLHNFVSELLTLKKQDECFFILQLSLYWSINNMQYNSVYMVHAI